MGILGVVWVSKSGLGILIRAPEVPFLVPPKRPKQPKLPIFNTFAFFSILEILVGPRRFQRRIVT
jgi:hypothetical protein